MDDGATCCALYGGNEGDNAEWSETTVVAARKSRKTGKEHICYECGDAIKVGTKHEVIKGVWDGKMYTHRTCLMCVEIRDHFACEEGWSFGEVWSQLEENFFPDMNAGGPCMTGLSPAAKRVLIDRRQAWLFDSEHERDGAPPPGFVYPKGWKAGT